MSDAVIITEAENRQVVEADAGTQVVEQVLTTGGGTVDQLARDQIAALDGRVAVLEEGGGGGGSGTDQTARDAAAAAQATANAALPKAGGTMTGKITLDGDPSSAFHAAPKQYVDTKQDAATAATDAELTAHASDTTAVHGIADTAALALTADVQPLDSDLTAIAALSTTTYGRSLLALADAAAGRASLGLGSAALLGQPTYRSMVLADSPALYWPLDDTYGATDQSANSRNGTGSGSITIGGYSGSPLPSGTKATDFDGTDDKITSSYTGCFTNSTIATFEGWARRDVRSADHQLFGDTGTNSAGLRIDTGSQQVTANLGSGSHAYPGAWPRNEGWVHWVLLTDEANDMSELYLNGVCKGTNYAAWSWPSTSGFVVGNRQDGSCPWNGQMAEVAIYPSLLSARRIMLHYLAGIGALIA